MADPKQQTTQPTQQKPPAPPTPAAPPAPEAKAEAKAETKAEANLPPKPSTLSPSDKTRVLNWKEQYDRGILFRCKEPGCYYPLNHKTNNIGQNAITPNGEMVMRCSWDPTHGGGEQLVKPKVKEGEVSDSEF